MGSTQTFSGYDFPGSGAGGGGGFRERRLGGGSFYGDIFHHGGVVTSSKEPDRESDQEELKDKEKSTPISAAAYVKEVKLKGQKFLKKKYKKFDLKSLVKT